LNTLTQKSVYFPNLNALRCFAASMVIVHHVEQTKYLIGVNSYWDTPTVHYGCKLGLFLFFVLSGFLITNLLLLEKKNDNTINIRNFYIRRILRIWPLYFLIIALALFVLPYFNFIQLIRDPVLVMHSNFTWKLLLFAFILPNLVMVLFGVIPYAAHTWSIGAEEQFYLLWPVIIKFIKNKFLFAFILTLILLYTILLKTLTHFVDLFPDNKTLFVIATYLNLTPINCMAIGGLFAVTCASDTPFFILLKKILFSKYLQYPVFSITIILLATGTSFYSLQYEVYSFLFGIIICNLALNKNRIIDFEKIKIFNYLGKISYGLYMFHPLVIIPVIKILVYYKCYNSYIMYLLSFGITILVSSASYHFYEKRFIIRKVKFSTLISGDNASKKEE